MNSGFAWCDSAGLDGQLVSNTWGDRSGGTKLNEAFIRRQSDAGKDLGVNVVQSDAAGATRFYAFQLVQNETVI